MFAMHDKVARKFLTVIMSLINFPRLLISL